MLKVNPRDKTRLVDPLFAAPGWRFWLAVVFLLAVIGWGASMYLRQLTYGLGETGMDRPVYWGIYMVNFIFLIGVSMAGTLISAALQLTNIEWRRPITRIAETLTVFGLLVASLQLLFDIGRPDRLLNVVQYGRLQSPLLWDANSLTLYILTSILALYLQLLPDIALLRDNCPANAPWWRRALYTRLGLGWKGYRSQWGRLQKAITVISIAIIPIGVSLHTITSWVFSTTVQPGWKSTILGPYFVIGAIFSGIGMLFIVMTLAWRLLKLDEYIQARHYRALGWLFIVMSALWFYFTYTENLTLVAEQEAYEFPVLASKLWGSYSFSFWGMVALMVVAFWIMVVPKLLPALLRRVVVFQPRFALASTGAALVAAFFLISPQPAVTHAALMDLNTNTFGWLMVIGFVACAGLGISFWLKQHPAVSSVAAGACVVAGMWLERWNIVIPTLTHPRLIPYTIYLPSPVEISLSAASLALLALMFLVFFKLFPVISIWEVSEGRVVEDAQSRVEIPLPEPNEPNPLQSWGSRR
ncbi:MAG: polysulfide reductase NrfD [Chloroflexi bacterium]|nr:polysulfide reductase NrfD [Chloroflexota bacterium]